MRGYLIERKKTKATRWIRYIYRVLVLLGLHQKQNHLTLCVLLPFDYPPSSVNSRVLTVIKVIFTKTLLLPRRFFAKVQQGISYQPDYFA